MRLRALLSPQAGAIGRILLVALPAVALAGGGAAFYLLRVAPRRPAPKPNACYLLSLTDLTVNLADRGRPRYLTASIAFTIAGEEPERKVSERDAQIRDAVLMVVSKHSYQELLSAEGKQALKEGLAAAVSEVLREDRLTVKEVLFTSFVMN
jgi:flagellar FliL protein